MKQPYFDVNTGKIHGCKRGSYSWRHEDRHRQQFKKKWVDAIDTYTHIFGYYIAGLFLIWWAVDVKNIMPLIGLGLSWIPYTLFSMILEVDAYVWAVRR